MSDDIAIRVEGLGKRYRYGQTLQLTRTFRETLMSLPAHLARKARRAFPHPTAQREGGGGDPDTPPGTFWALRDVSFDVRRGETIGIIGRNGAGKSTLLKILSRITMPTAGRAVVQGRLSSLLEVGTGFHPELTGRENVYLNGAILGMRRAEINRKFEEIVAFAEVERFLDTPVKRYSSGMLVRLAFAVAAHLEPEILVVDEVLAVGDAQFQKKCLGKMDSVAREG
ncbi:ABC transporter ATP-binding protein, partial [Candidatus Sumerlaeota bacterium]|nr:ABC transporter ATP-binding protein [Candidatus Sumerlaeota bacterium]